MREILRKSLQVQIWIMQIRCQIKLARQAETMEAMAIMLTLASLQPILSPHNLTSHFWHAPQLSILSTPYIDTRADQSAFVNVY